MYSCVCIVAFTSKYDIKNFQVSPELPSSVLVDGDSEQSMPVTSLLSRWNVPRVRKESNLQLSDAIFEKHDYQKPVKRKRRQIKDFDPRPEEYRGNAKQLLGKLLENVKGESLGVSLLFDEQCSQAWSSVVIPVYHLHLTSKAPAQLRHVEQSTREQQYSAEWFAIRRYRITASHFGEILHRRRDTPPDRLVLSILMPRKFSSPATTWGIENESRAIQAYIEHIKSCDISELTVGPCGFFICEDHPFLGATPDGTVYDPSNSSYPFGFLEVKCPYSHRDRSPAEACAIPGFCSQLGTLPDGSKQVMLRRNHPYFAQVQGQMAVGRRAWCDFVIYTKSISIKRIYFDEDYWLNTLLPKLVDFLTIV